MDLSTKPYKLKSYSKDNISKIVTGLENTISRYRAHCGHTYPEAWTEVIKNNHNAPNFGIRSNKTRVS